MRGDLAVKNKIIQFIKKHPFLYNLAKKFNRKTESIPVKIDYVTNTIYYTYLLKKEEELPLIKKHYNAIRKDNTRLFVIVDNAEYNKYMHKFIRENVNVLFASLDFFKTYHKNLNANRLVMLDYHQDMSNTEVLDFLK